MACETGNFEGMLAAAAGDDPALFHELRAVFIDSVLRQVDLLRRSRCDGNWQVAALRLEGLAASFDAEPLRILAGQALEGAPGDPAIIRRLLASLDDLSRHA